MNHLHNILKIGGSLGSFVLANSLDPTGCTGAIVQAIAGNLASNFVAKYDPAELLKHLNKPNPELNHDIEKLMIESVPKAVELVTIKYYQENPYDDKFVKKTLKRLIEDAKTMPNNTDDGLMTTDKDAWLEGIHEYIFRGYEDEEGKLLDIETFFKNHLKNCYQLVFTEGLKDDKNEKPLKAFLIKSFNGLAEQAEKNSEIQAKILAEIQKLKDEKTAQSFTIAKSYFENEFNKIDKKLIELLEIAKKTDGKIDLIYQYFGIIEQKIDKIIGILQNQVLPPSKHLTRPPLVPEVFRGRKNELEKIHKQLFEGENLLLLVNGEGGIGKTSLAAKYYHQYTAHYKHLAWVLCEQSITDALLQLAFPLKLQFEDTATSTQRLEILLTHMANMNTPCLLIIDNANEVEDLQQNYEHLRRCPNFHVLLTSRINDYRHAQFFKIKSLSPEQALLVFREHYPKLQTKEESIFEGIYDAVGGNTLVLELLAKNVAQQNSLKTKYQLADLLADLQTKGLLKIVEDEDVAVEYQSYRNAKPTEIIAAMYDLSKLSEAEIRLLSIFAVLPAENIAYEILETLLPNTQNLDKTLLSLAQKGWLSHNTTDSSFKCSPVIQEITIAKNQNLYEDCDELIRVLIRMFDYEVNDSGNLVNYNFGKALFFSRLGESIITNFKTKTNVEIQVLCRFIGNYFRSCGYLEKAYRTFYTYRQLSKKVLQINFNHDSYRYHLAISSFKLGEIYQSYGDDKKSLIYYSKTKQEFEKLVSSNEDSIDFKNGLAIAYLRLSEIFLANDGLNNSLVYINKAISIFENISKIQPEKADYLNGLATCFGVLGEIYLRLEKYDISIIFLKKDYQISKKLYEKYPNKIGFKNGLASSYLKLGYFYNKINNENKAIFFLRKHKNIINNLVREFETHIGYKNSQAISYFNLAEVYVNCNEKKIAIKYYLKALSIWERLLTSVPQHAESQKKSIYVKNILKSI